MGEAEALLQDRPEERWTLARLSQRLGASPSLLQGSFRAVYGMSPGAFLRARRMRYAAELLRRSDGSILTIAGQLGYDNASKFARAFRQVMGVSPSDYRRGPDSCAPGSVHSGGDPLRTERKKGERGVEWLHQRKTCPKWLVEANPRGRRSQYSERTYFRMKKTAVIYWSGTGNTEAMANAVLEGMKSAGAEADLLTPDAGGPRRRRRLRRHRLRLPRHGRRDPGGDGLRAHVLRLQGHVSRARAWGSSAPTAGASGDWMRTWEKDCDESNIGLAVPSVICCEAPDETALEACRAMGKALAQ